MKKGFTLVELLIAIAIFSILVAIGVGGFVHALHTQREVASLIAAQSNASVALEEMTREIRTGYLFCTTPNNENNPEAAVPGICQADSLGLGSGCTKTGDANDPTWVCNDIIDFYNADTQNVDYELVNGSLQRSQTGPAGTFTTITGDNVTISNLTFTIFGNKEGDNWPPRITISMGVAPSSTDPAVAGDVLHLQTTVSAREIDCTTNPTVSC